MKRHVAVAAALAMLLTMPGFTAGAGASVPIETDTTARVCCPGSPSGELENFGGYVLNGTVEPSMRGQIVRFSYKRPSADRWRGFKVAGDDGVSGTGFYVLNKQRPRDRLSAAGRFRAEFTPSVRPGRWLIRVVFPEQGRYLRSVDVIRVEVAGSD